MRSLPFKHYYRLTKPGIVYGNLYTAAAGYMFASKTHIDVRGFLIVLLGTALIVASGCVVNNITDIEIDKKMARTKRRALVSGIISKKRAVYFATILGISGFGILIVYINWLTVIVGLIGFIDYTVAYAIAKRRSPHSTLIGSVSGATPILAGYTGAAGLINTEAVVLFMAMVFWQMPHFYAIGLFQRHDYKKARIPLLTETATQKRMTHIMSLYVWLFAVTALSLGFVGSQRHTIYTIAIAVMSILWLKTSLEGYQAPDQQLWAKRVFKQSLLVLLLFSIFVALAYRLP